MTVARQPDKYALDNRARKLTCHPGRNETYPVPNARAHGGAMRLNELKYLCHVWCPDIRI